MSVSEVAERTGASESSIVGFCKNLGATDFQQIKIALAQEIVRPVQFIHVDLEPSDIVDTTIRKTKARRDSADLTEDAAGG